MRSRRWVYAALPDRPALEESLQRRLTCSPLVVKLLLARGIESPEQAKAYLSPSLDALLDPFWMRDMEVAVQRLHRAITRHERILVYGDYDVDGVTSVALMYGFIRDMGVLSTHVHFYIPDRYNEGYGISPYALRQAHELGITLVITLDCGIKAIEEAEQMRSLGIDLIVCDHHLPGDTLPNAIALLNPKRPDCSYPFKELSGCGVGFKLVQAYCHRFGPRREFAWRYMHLLAISIASDMVELRDENRIMAYWGLHALNTQRHAGIDTLRLSCGMGLRDLTIEDLIYRIGPRLNAAGRMGSGATAVRLLVCREEDESQVLVEEIAHHNADRQSVDREITSQAIARVAQDPDLENASSLVLYDPLWHRGVVGIVASRLVDTYQRPTIILTEVKGLATGSVRGVGNVDLHAAVAQCEDLLVAYGGHRFAVGVTMKTENVDTFRTRFERIVASQLTEAERQPHLDIDALISLDELAGDLPAWVERMAPFGPTNASPKFALLNVNATAVRRVGRKGDHLKFLIKGPWGTEWECMAFGRAATLNLTEGQRVDICFVIEANRYSHNKRYTLNIKDIRPSA